MSDTWDASDPNTPTFAGPLSLFRLPSGPLEGAEVAFYGAPLDLTTTGRPGARLGPRAVRVASTMISWGVSFPHGLSLQTAARAVDLGDCLFDHGRAGDFEEKLLAYARRVVAAGAAPLVIGGDHFVAYPTLKALAERHGPLALIHFDAHPDTWPDEGERRRDHGTMFYHAVKEGLIDPSASVQVGLRTHVDDHMGLLELNAPWVHARGAQETVKAIRERVGDRPAYVTFDIDCLDPAFAPGTGTPVPGGLSSAQALEVLRGLSGLRVLGGDVVEVSPPYDHADITALVGAQVMIELYALVVARLRAEGAR